LADPNLRNDPEVHAKLKELKSVLTQSSKFGADAAFPAGNRKGRLEHLEHEEGVRSAGAEIAETEGLGVTSGRKAGSKIA